MEAKKREKKPSDGERESNKKYFYLWYHINVHIAWHIIKKKNCFVSIQRELTLFIYTNEITEIPITKDYRYR